MDHLVTDEQKASGPPSLPQWSSGIYLSVCVCVCLGAFPLQELAGRLGGQRLCVCFDSRNSVGAGTLFQGHLRGLNKCLLGGRDCAALKLLGGVAVMVDAGSGRQEQARCAVNTAK